ncbi:MAG: tRNA 2-thiocytidine biosynthesis TtcA family protein [Treponema sp.]|jgi:tRNA(Ile)-lysidine synthase TilS/MesJ|nr:tRNA 2-thiocytidine biosynthesis TtcA family protein [Treponema sp.]
MPQPKIFSLIDKAIFDYNMIEKNDRVLLGASGGKDSNVLLDYFATRLKRPDCFFSLTAAHVQTEISPPLTKEQLKVYESWNIDLVTIPFSILDRVQPGRRMNCWWCSTQRRKELLDYAVQHRYTKIALGHHLDDILETLLMNMLYKQELSTMPPKLAYKKFPVTVIRPLCYVTVDTITEHAASRGYLSSSCTCSYQDNSGRKEARTRLSALTDGDPSKKAHLFFSLRNRDPAYLP